MPLQELQNYDYKPDRRLDLQLMTAFTGLLHVISLDLKLVSWRLVTGRI